MLAHLKKAFAMLAFFLLLKGDSKSWSASTTTKFTLIQFCDIHPKVLPKGGDVPLLPLLLQSSSDDDDGDDDDVLFLHLFSWICSFLLSLL